MGVRVDGRRTQVFSIEHVKCTTSLGHSNILQRLTVRYNVEGSEEKPDINMEMYLHINMYIHIYENLCMCK